MNIIEAIRSGKRFRRKSWAVLDWAKVRSSEVMVFDNGSVYHASPCDILADDWEVEEKKVEITESQLKAALFSPTERKSFEDIARELGLRD